MEKYLVFYDHHKAKIRREHLRVYVDKTSLFIFFFICILNSSVPFLIILLKFNFLMLTA